MDSDKNNEDGINYIVGSLVSLGLNEKAAQALTYLKILEKGTFFQISKETGLRQPEFSVAINGLKNRGWIYLRLDKIEDIYIGMMTNKSRSQTCSGVCRSRFDLAVAGLKRLIDKKKFSNGKTLNEVKLQYTRQSDPVKAFATEKLEHDSITKKTDDEMYTYYAGYCEVHNLEPELPGRFKGMLKCLGYINGGQGLVLERGRYKKWIDHYGCAMWLSTLSTLFCIFSSCKYFTKQRYRKNRG